MFKSPIQPLCRYCGEPIPKLTRAEFFGQSGGSLSAKPQSREEAQRFFNEQIISVNWWPSKSQGKMLDGYGTKYEGYIHRVGLWDGESYMNEFFCSSICAQRLGRLLAREGRCTKSYINAVATHKAKETA